jgi:hypothetical protein
MFRRSVIQWCGDRQQAELRRCETRLGKPVADLCRPLGVTEATVAYTASPAARLRLEV